MVFQDERAAADLQAYLHAQLPDCAFTVFRQVAGATVWLQPASRRLLIVDYPGVPRDVDALLHWIEPLATAEDMLTLVLLRDASAGMRRDLPASVMPFPDPADRLSAWLRQWHAGKRPLPPESPVRVRLERDLFQLRLMEARGELEQNSKNAVMGLLTAGICHDINNLLSVLSGFGEMAQDDRQRLERLPRLLVEQCERGRDIVGSLLKFYRAKRDDAADLSLEEELRSVFRLLEYQSHRHGVILSMELQPGVSAHASRGVLQQVMINLLLNAIQASNRGGRVRVESRKCNGIVEIRVRDDGPGIPADKLPLLFTHSQRSGKPQGAGLGLFLCRRLLEDAHGGIRAENSPDGGAVFTVTLPAHPAPGNSVADRQPVLIIEDDPLIRDMLASLLRDHGYRVESVETGEEGWERLRQREYGTLLLDVNLPGSMTGIEVARMLRTLPSPPRLVIVTGELPDGALADVSRQAEGFIRKPFKLQQILDAVQVA